MPGDWGLGSWGQTQPFVVKLRMSGLILLLKREFLVHAGKLRGNDFSRPYVD